MPITAAIVFLALAVFRSGLTLTVGRSEAGGIDVRSDRPPLRLPTDMPDDRAESLPYASPGQRGLSRFCYDALPFSTPLPLLPPYAGLGHRGAEHDGTRVRPTDRRLH